MVVFINTRTPIWIVLLMHRNRKEVPRISGSTHAPHVQVSWGYDGTQYSVRSYPPFGYSIPYKEYNLTGFSHQNNATQARSSSRGMKPSRKQLAVQDHQDSLGFRV